MKETNTAAHTKVTMQELPGAASEDQVLLAAALAAVLVEYRRHVRQRGLDERSTSAGNNWRMMACWERLRGRG